MKTIFNKQGDDDFVTKKKLTKKQKSDLNKGIGMMVVGGVLLAMSGGYIGRLDPANVSAFFIIGLLVAYSGLKRMGWL